MAINRQNLSLCCDYVHLWKIINNRPSKMIIIFGVGAFEKKKLQFVYCTILRTSLFFINKYGEICEYMTAYSSVHKFTKIRHIIYQRTISVLIVFTTDISYIYIQPMGITKTILSCGLFASSCNDYSCFLQSKTCHL